MTPLEFFMHTFPNGPGFKRDADEWRAYVGRYGVSGRMQTAKIATLSDGQKSRVVFAMLCMKNHSLLLLDEPTNHLVSVCARVARSCLCVSRAFLFGGGGARALAAATAATNAAHQTSSSHAAAHPKRTKNPPHSQDMDAIDSLAAAINKYDGGVVLVSHDFRLIDQVAKSIWVCENKAVKPWNSGIREYKALLARKMKKAAAA